MKNTLRIVIAVLAVICLAVSLTGCNLFATMRRNAELAAQVEILDDPDDDTAFEELNNFIDAAFDNAEGISESVSYKASSVSVTKDGEKAGLLGSAANTLRDLIMSANPGSSSRAIESRDDAGLLGKIEKSSASDYEIGRHQESEQVTDEKGNEVTDAEGNVVHEIKTVDNILTFDIKYFTTETVTDEEGNEKEEHIPADAEAIEAVFGEPADKAEVISAFDCVKDYISLGDYTTEYADCKINASVDMASGEVQSVTFTKTILVNAAVTGCGALAEYGEMNVEIVLTKNVSYSFDYPVSEDMV